MSNMSYCKFQNTLADLQDCADTLFSGELDLSYEEQRALEHMMELCIEMLDFCGIELSDDYEDIIRKTTF